MKASIIAELIKNSSVAFAGIEYNTEIKPAAKFKHVNITKRTKANVQVFGNINEFTSVYRNAVLRKNPELTDFTPQESYFDHTDCYSIVTHKTNGKEYLYCIYNNAQSQYFIDGVECNKSDILQFLTPSLAASMQKKASDSDVIVRTISVDNITKFTCNKHSITA